MEQWYLPIYILPGIGLLIMSTALLQGSLSTELSALLKEDVEFMKEIIENIMIITISSGMKYLFFDNFFTLIIVINYKTQQQ